MFYLCPIFFSDTVDMHLAEFMWRRKHENNVWNGFLELLRLELLINIIS